VTLSGNRLLLTVIVEMPVCDAGFRGTETDMAYSVDIDLPTKVVLNKDVRFVIRSDNAKLGEFLISKGGIDWYPANKKTPITKTWKQFDRLMQSGS
jgi:hypothetical protein